eukprot:750075-Hanusia_phi.AAC.1
MSIIPFNSPPRKSAHLESLGLGEFPSSAGPQPRALVPKGSGLAGSHGLGARASLITGAFAFKRRGSESTGGSRQKISGGSLLSHG